MMKKNVLQDSLFVERQEKAARERYARSEQSLQKAVADITRLRNVKFTDAEQLAEVTPAWIEADIEKSKQNLSQVFGAGGFIPDGIAQQFHSEYERVRRDSREPIETIQNGVSYCKQSGIRIHIDENGVPHYDEKDVERLVKVAATHTFTDEQKGFFPLFAQLIDTINDIRKYEAAVGAKPCDIPTILTVHLSSEKLAGHSVIEFTPEHYFALLAYGRVLFHEDNDNDE